MLGPKVCYLGLPKSGSSSLYKFIFSTNKGHEVDIKTIINVAYRQKGNDDKSTAVNYLVLRHMYYRLDYDICTMFSLFPDSVVKAYAETRYISIVREPLEWSISFLNYADYVRRRLMLKTNSHYWDMVPELLNPSKYAEGTQITTDWGAIFESLLNYWLTATLASTRAMEARTSLIVKLSNIDENLDILKDFLGMNNVRYSATKFPNVNTARDHQMGNRAYSPSRNNYIEDELIKKHVAIEYYKDMKSKIVYNL